MAATGTNSVFSTGSTSRNQPIAPRNARMSPTTLTTTCMTNPAAKSVSPKAVTIGQGVGAGTIIFPGCGSCFCSAAICFLRYSFALASQALAEPPLTTKDTKITKKKEMKKHFSELRVLRGEISLLSTADDVHDSENHHPHAIDEMPVPGDHFDVLGIVSSHKPTKAQPKNQAK